MPPSSKLYALIVHSKPLVPFLANSSNETIIMRPKVTNNAFKEIDWILLLFINFKDLWQTCCMRDKVEAFKNFLSTRIFPQNVEDKHIWRIQYLLIRPFLAILRVRHINFWLIDQRLIILEHFSNSSFVFFDNFKFLFSWRQNETKIIKQRYFKSWQWVFCVNSVYFAFKLFIAITCESFSELNTQLFIICHFWEQHFI